MNTLLKKYNVEFKWEKYPSGKFMQTARGGGIAEFLSNCTDPDSVNEALENVDYYLNGGGI